MARTRRRRFLVDERSDSDAPKWALRGRRGQPARERARNKPHRRHRSEMRASERRWYRDRHIERWD